MDDIRHLVDQLTAGVRRATRDLAADAPAVHPTREALTAAHRLLDAAQALQALLVMHLAAAGAFRADGARDTAGWLRTIGARSAHAARLAADSADACRSSDQVRTALVEGVVTAEAAAALAPLVRRSIADDHTAGAARAAVASLLAVVPAFAPDAFRREVRRVEAELEHPDDRSSRQRHASSVREFDAADRMRGLTPVLDHERHTVVRNALDALLDVGRARRLATHAQRVAMRRRRPTCEFGVCDIPAERCRAHHLRPWEVGGSTDLDQLAWLCDAHHHLVHDGGWSMARADGQIVIHRPDGTLLLPPATEVRDARAA